MWIRKPLLAALASALVASTAPALEPAEPLDATSAVKEPIGVVTLGEALSAALAGNPELAAFSTEVRISEAHALQAGLRPNPEISTEVEDVGGSGDYAGWDSGQTTISLAQLLELGGKRAKRQRVAELQRDLADWDYQTRRVDVFAEVGQAFIGTLAAQERLSLADDFLRLATESARTVSATVRTGAVSRVEESRALAALGQARAQRAEIERALAGARITLAAAWGSAEPRFDSVRGDLGRIGPVAPVESLLAVAEHNPDLARWQAERAQRRAAVALEKARRIPDLTVAAGGRHYADNGDGAAVFGFAVPLPLFDRNQGNVLAAERTVVQTDQRQRAAVVAVHAALRSGHEALAAAFRQATELRDQVIPHAQRTHEGAVAAYTRGLFRYLEVLDAQRTLYEVRGHYIDALEQYHLAAVSVDRLAGVAGATRRDGEANESK